MIQNDDVLYETLTSAIARLDDVLDKQPNKIDRDLFAAVRLVVCGRDELIRRQRDRPDVETGELLNALNSVLSVLSGGEYPVVGVHLDRIKGGRDALSSLIGYTSPQEA